MGAGEVVGQDGLFFFVGREGGRPQVQYEAYLSRRLNSPGCCGLAISGTKYVPRPYSNPSGH